MQYEGLPKNKVAVKKKSAFALGPAMLTKYGEGDFVRFDPLKTPGDRSKSIELQDAYGVLWQKHEGFYRDYVKHALGAAGILMSCGASLVLSWFQPLNTTGPIRPSAAWLCLHKEASLHVLRSS